MLLTEWNTEDAKKVWYEDGVEDGLEQGREQGLELGLEQGLKQAYDEKLIIARNLLSKGSTPEFVSEITGLSLEEIAKL